MNFFQLKPNNPHRFPVVAAFAVLAFLLVVICVTESVAKGAVDYAKDIKPILAERCFACHGRLKSEGGLRLDAASLIGRGGDSGLAVVAGKPGESPLLRRVTSSEDERMPPEGSPLTEEQVTLLERWIANGAPMPSDEPIPPSPQDHWAFSAPKPKAPPTTAATWVHNDLDRFLAQTLETHRLVPSDEASRSVLLRRVYLDLVGVPPTREQRQEFLNDKSPEAYEHMVDELLASPLYGQRWARHWMDVWRYSDPSGYGAEIRDGRQHIWQWRDWIVESLNEDVGYDQMIIQMLAADEAFPDDLDKARATGFLARNWYKFNRNVWLDNIVEHSSKAFLGLTPNCSRCHDHKYDPISQADYYALRAIFETHDVRDTPAVNGRTVVRAYDADLARPTYLFSLGDERKPDKSRVLSPGVPSIFPGQFDVHPIQLPVAAYYPALRPAVHRNQIADLERAVETAEKNFATATTQLATLREQMVKESKEPKEAKEVKETKPVPAEIIHEDRFEKLDDKFWKVASGSWTAGSELQQSAGETVQHRLVSTYTHPADFTVQTKLRITGGEMWRSVGIGFDGHGQGMSAVYLSAFSGGTKVQVSTQGEDGKWSYPTAGAKTFPVELNRDYLVELRVRDKTLNVLIDGEFVLAFQLPAIRKPGQISLWTFSATAQFREYRLESLPPDVDIVPVAGQSSTVASLKVRIQSSEHGVAASKLRVTVAQQNLAAYEARYAAELVKFGLDTDGDLAQVKTRAIAREHVASVSSLALQIADARAKRDLAAAGLNPAQAELDKQAKEIEALVGKHEKLASATSHSETYSPLGTVYPATSSGRRLAFAKWITDRQNPLTARVAVNHVWRHHFGTPLVERVFDFGMRSPSPTHLELLDWLSVQFMDEGWSMKKLHRTILTSAAYRRESSVRDQTRSNLAVDQDNRLCWRMNVRRMDAEVVRDSMLYLGNYLDVSEGGAPLQHDQGQTTFRRSLYYRHDKERQMTFLNLFDGANVNECYERRPTVSPQQALAMYNSQLADKLSRELATKIPGEAAEYVINLFRHIIGREPTSEELGECTAFYAGVADRDEARYQLALVLLNHNDFVTIR